MCEKGKYVSFHSMTKIYTEKKTYTLILRKSFCFNSSSSMVIFLLGMLHHTQSLSVQGVHLQMCMAVSVFKEWVIHHCSSCGDIFCLKFNLHLFQTCHKNAYKEQAHDLDLQCLHSPQTLEPSKNCTDQQETIPRTAPAEKERDLSKEPCLHAGEPVEKEVCSFLFTMEFLHLPKALMVTTTWWRACEASSAFWDNAEVHPAWITSQWSSHGKFPRWQTLGESRVSIPEMAGTSGRCSYPSTWVPLQTQSYREQAHKGSQIHACINCKDEAVQHSNIKSVGFKYHNYLSEE